MRHVVLVGPGDAVQSVVQAMDAAVAEGIDLGCRLAVILGQMPTQTSVLAAEPGAVDPLIVLRVLAHRSLLWFGAWPGWVRGFEGVRVVKEV
jgi:hypothetical protein